MIDIEKNLFDRMKTSENRIFREVSKIMDRFKKTEEGNLDPFQSLDFADLKKRLRRTLRKSGYEDNLGKYFRDFDKVDSFNRKIHEDVNGIKLSKVNLSKAKREFIDQISVEMTSFDKVDANFTKPIRDLITRNVLSGRGFEETKKALEKMIKTDPKRFGILSRWSYQIAFDAVNRYDGKVNDEIRKEYGLNAYRYVGSLIDESRPQCRRWIRKGTIKEEELSSEISWSLSQGSGQNPIITPETFAEHRGGYNCRHQAIPVRI